MKFSRDFVNTLMGVSVIFLFHTFYGVQDIIHYQLVPNIPIMSITLAIGVFYHFGARSGIAGFLLYFLYYWYHFLFMGYHYFNDPTIVTCILFVCCNLICYWFWKAQSRPSKAELVAKIYQEATANIVKKIDTLEG